MAIKPNTEAGTVAARMTQRSLVAAREIGGEVLSLVQASAREGDVIEPQVFAPTYSKRTQIITVSQRELRRALSGVRMPPPARLATFR